MLTAILATKGIFTNGIASWADRILQKMAIRRHFGPIIDVRATDYRGKPWPEAYRRALDLLGCEGASCALVDDQPRNLEQAAAFGMRTVLVRPGGQVGPGVDFAVDAIEETGAVLRKLVNGNQKSVMGNE
jgi:putative hydrolase of the HAD superfamily